VLLGIAGSVLLVFGAYVGESLVLVVLILAMLLLSTYYDACGKLADAQIEEIVAEPERATKLKTEFTQMRNNP
jgi:hypothetical protein